MEMKGSGGRLPAWRGVSLAVVLSVWRESSAVGTAIQAARLGKEGDSNNGRKRKRFMAELLATVFRLSSRVENTCLLNWECRREISCKDI